MAYVDHMSGAQIAAQTAYSRATAGNLIADAFLNGITRVRGWLAARQTARELRKLQLLSPHLLRDIGVDAPDVPARMPTNYFELGPRL